MNRKQWEAMPVVGGDEEWQWIFEGDGDGMWADTCALIDDCIDIGEPPSSMLPVVGKRADVPQIDTVDFCEECSEILPRDFAANDLPESILSAFETLNAVLSVDWPETWVESGKRLSDDVVAALDDEYDKEMST